MNKIEYSALVMRKMKSLEAWLADYFDEKTAKRVIKGIISDAGILSLHARSGTCIESQYGIKTEYWYLVSHQHYLIYRIEPGRVVIVQMFHKREDFIRKLFGISGRTQESIDYWGE